MTEHSAKISHHQQNSDEWKKYFTTKEISANHDYPFNFKNSNWYVTVIFLITFLLAPIIYSLVKRYGFDIIPIDGRSPAPWNKIDIVIRTLLPLIGMAITFAVDWKLMIKRGGWIAYTHFLFGIISANLTGLFLIETGVLTVDNKDPFYIAITFLIQVIIQFIGSLIVIFTNKTLRNQIVTTLKEAKVDLVVWIFVFLAIVSILNFIFKTISDNVNTNIFLAENDNSKNQNELILMSKIPLGVFTLILGSIFLAPINEEISYRFGMFSIIRNKWLAFSASLIYFPAMHVMANGDWDKIFGYLSMGIMAPLLFICARGNSTYTIGLHMLLNTVATIYLFIGK